MTRAVASVDKSEKRGTDGTVKDKTEKGGSAKKAQAEAGQGGRWMVG